ncbi:MAG TPA: VanZ family protein [Pyrinomonadaceae bacterium]|nr:VanZ family protein [Pyrinomonadaceae bacterium]
MTQTEKSGDAGINGRAASRVWRYGPLLLWMAFIFFASTAQLSASNTSRIIRPLLIWLFPEISEETLAFVHFIVRKLAHLTEYAILGLLAARAFLTSSRQGLRRRWFLFAWLLVIIYALSDELHQRFVPARTGSIYDSLIDIAGGFIALSLLAVWRKVKKREEK